MKTSASLLLGLLGLATHAVADPTWPSDIDELEEIMYQVFSFRSRKFADTVNPCTSEASGPGRSNAAEWLRTAFHDMSTANIVQGFGGLDASLQYELTNGENSGPGFGTTMSFMAPYLTTKSSMSDLIALGVYTSVRSCGGPVVPIRAGRKDATTGGNTGVPQPQNEIGIFRNQFSRMGFSPQEMIQVTACGHTIGGVHANEFPDIVPKGSFPNDQAVLDSSNTVFDNKIITEYLDGSTKNPLVVGPAVAIKKHSDFKVFSSDGNVTMQALADATAFNNVCKTVLQKMIDVVPPGVALGTPILPYTVKPVNLQLTLATGGTALTFTGFIRVRTTETPAATIAGLTINYKNRNGGTTCGSGPCTISLSIQGVGRGFDDTFAFYPITSNIPVSSGISSFTVTVRKTDGSSVLYDNNGNGYPLQDGILLQMPQSCLLQGTGATTIVAAVRNDRATLPAKVVISYKVKRTTSVVPSLNNVTLALTKGACVGSYTFFSADYTIPGDLSFESFVDVISGDGAGAVADSFKDVNEIGGTCQAYSGPGTCASVTVSSTTVAPTSTIASSTSVVVTTTAAPTGTLAHKPTVGAYSLVGCQTEGDGVRALSGPTTASDDMTLEICAAFCASSSQPLFGVEYGRECYCGTALAPSSLTAPLTDCSMTCAGTPFEYCGAGNRLLLYSTAAPSTSSTTKPPTTTSSAPASTSTAPSTSTSKVSSVATTSTTSAVAPTGTLAHQPTIGKYSLVGCQKEGVGVRALDGAATASDDMTLEKCAAFCDAFVYFGTEYGRECYCGNTLAASSVPAPLTDCGMTCAGSPLTSYCGSGDRLELYKVGGTASTLATSTSSTSTSTSKASSSTTTSTSSVPTSTSTTKPASSTTLSTSTRSSSTSRATTTSSRSSSSTRITSTSTTRSTTSSVRTSTTSTRTSSSTRITSTSTSTSSTSLRTSTTSTSRSTSTSSTPSTSTSKSTSTNTSKASTSTAASTTVQTAPAHKPTVPPYALVGCWTEGVGERTLGQKSYAAADMTLESCAAFCTGFTYFGTEYSSECWCGDVLASSSFSAALTDCSMPCSGNPLELCGGGSRLTLYKKDGPVSGPSQPAVAGWTSLGCQTETTTGPRALSAAATASDNMTNEACAAFCTGGGYTFFGTQYSRECYCGNEVSSASLPAAASQCNMLCSGSSLQWCGGNARISLYQKNL